MKTPKKLVLVLLALAAAACLALVVEPVWLRLWTRWKVDRLDSPDRSEFSNAYGALAYDRDPRVSELLLGELERARSREVYYQITRIVYTRCEVHYAPEDAKLSTWA